MNAEKQDTLANDDSHPIPCLTALDIFGVKNDGGADLVLIIASPLEADERSQRRLLQKIENYLGFISSEEFLAEAGPPSPANTKIIVKVHPDSDSAISELLDRCVDWVAENNATLVVEDL
jgi:hypothetical protein